MGKLIAVLGERASGKSTIVGTLPGKTCMFIMRGEAGGGAARALAKKHGNTVDIVDLPTYQNLVELLNEKIPGGEYDSYDNLAFDSLTIISEEVYKSKEVSMVRNKNAFDGNDLYKLKVIDFVVKLKSFTNKFNVLCTCAIKVERGENELPTDFDLTMIGGKTKNAVIGAFSNITCIYTMQAEDGSVKRRLITNNWNGLTCRLQDILDEDNPKKIDPDLSKVLELITLGE